MRIEGLWEVVDVTDINPSVCEVWKMRDNILEVFQNDKIYDKGKYVVIAKGPSAYLKLANLKNPTFNTNWVIFLLSKDKLIIGIEVSGGIFYKEFVKKTGN